MAEVTIKQVRVCATDLKIAIRYMEDAVTMYRAQNSESTRIRNRIRLIKLLVNKLNQKLIEN